MKIAFSTLCAFMVCEPPPVVEAPPPHPFEAPSDAELVDTCLNLIRLGCEEGCDGGPCYNVDGDTCLIVVTRIRDLHLTELGTTCVRGAKSKAQVRACSSFWEHACLP